jgi:hypothetical protein
MIIVLRKRLTRTYLPGFSQRPWVSLNSFDRDQCTGQPSFIQSVFATAADPSAEDDFNQFANNIADNVVRGGPAIVADVADEGATALEAIMQGLGGTMVS